MSRGPAPQWRRRKDPVLDDYVMASVTRAGGLGAHHPQTGHYGELVIRGLADREEADEWKRALFRAAHYLSRHGIAQVSMSARVERSGNGYLIRFSAVDKVLARKHILDTYGPDVSKWPYDPRRRGGD